MTTEEEKEFKLNQFILLAYSFAVIGYPFKTEGNKYWEIVNEPLIRN